MRKLWIVFLFLAMLLTGCEESNNIIDEITNYDISKTSVIIDTISTKIHTATTELETQAEDVLDTLSDPDILFENNMDILETFYKDSLQRSKILYKEVEDLSVEYFREILSQKIIEEEIWYEATDDFFFLWNEVMQGYYFTFTDVFSKIDTKCYTILEDIRSEQEVETYNAIWNEYEMKSKEAQSSILSEYDLFYGDIFTMYDEIQCSFLDKTIDIESVLNREEIIDVEEEFIEPTPEWIDGMRYGYKISIDNYREFYVQYFTFLDTYDPEAMDQVQFQRHMDLKAQKGGYDLIFSQMEEDAINEKEATYYSDTKKWVADKLVEYEG
ncbi:MAG: hypothetical protein E7191_02965 [Erysipelotrichaceae bacterium]|nr:hypothetical protein [Erysipelotrichaceae bacterium]